MTAYCAEALRNLVPEIALNAIHLDKMKVKVRDFPEQTTIYLLKLTERNKALIKEKISDLPEYSEAELFEVQYKMDKIFSDWKRTA